LTDDLPGANALRQTPVGGAGAQVAIDPEFERQPLLLKLADRWSAT
jgi:hypothetical protein